MKKIGLLFALPLCLGLSACAGGLPSHDGFVTLPAPLDPVSIDENALNDAYTAFDTALYAVDLWRVATKLEPGSPKALRIANLIDKAKAGFEIAYKVRIGLSTEDPRIALEASGAALSEITSIIKGDSP